MFAQVFSLGSRALNVIHGGRAAETFSERCERRQSVRYFRVWRAIINDVFGFFGDHNHTLRVTIERRLDRIKALEDEGFTIAWPK